jgi:serine/threonine protein kinase
VLQSLAFLHSLGLVHSDLKPENILIKSYSRWGRDRARPVYKHKIEVQTLYWICLEHVLG